MTGRVDQKVALITGAARGQGASHGELLAREGAKVVLTDVRDVEGEGVAHSLREAGLEAVYCHLDVSRADEWNNAVSTTEQQFGPVTVLVNNAGVGSSPGFEDCTDEEWHRVVGINQTGVFFGIRAVIPGMKGAGGGSIINISSNMGHTGGYKDGIVAYVATKTAVLGLTRHAALALGQYGIRANSISPGMVDTALLGSSEHTKRSLEIVPLGRYAQPEEISQAVLYLASDESLYVSGADLMIDGGQRVA